MGPSQIAISSLKVMSYHHFPLIDAIPPAIHIHTWFLYKRVVSDGTFPNLLMSFQWTNRVSEICQLVWLFHRPMAYSNLRAMSNRGDLGDLIGFVLLAFGHREQSHSCIDLKVILPFYACQSAVLTWCRWNVLHRCCLCIHCYQCVFWCSHVFCVHQIRSSMAAKLDSGDASALMLGFHGFRPIPGSLWWCCYRRTMTIVDDTTWLQRVLKCSCDRFQEFLAQEAQHGVAAGLPRGNPRVSLQGAVTARGTRCSFDGPFWHHTPWRWRWFSHQSFFWLLFVTGWWFQILYLL